MKWAIKWGIKVGIQVWKSIFKDYGLSAIWIYGKYIYLSIMLHFYEVIVIDWNTYYLFVLFFLWCISWRKDEEPLYLMFLYFSPQIQVPQPSSGLWLRSLQILPQAHADQMQDLKEEAATKKYKMTTTKTVQI